MGSAEGAAEARGVLMAAEAEGELYDACWGVCGREPLPLLDLTARREGEEAEATFGGYRSRAEEVC